MTTKLTKLRVSKVALVDLGANPEAEVMLFKRGDPTTGGLNLYHPPLDRENAGERRTQGDQMPDAETIDKADHDAEVATLTEQIEALTAQVATLTVTPDEIDKSALPEAVQKRLAAADALEVRVAKMESEARLERFTKTAREEFGDLAAAEDLGPALEEIDRLAPDAAKKIHQILKSVAARAADSSLFKELGAGGLDSSDDPKAQAQALIDAEVAKGASILDATRAVFQSHPDLWEVRK